MYSYVFDDSNEAWQFFSYAGICSWEQPVLKSYDKVSSLKNKEDPNWIQYHTERELSTDKIIPFFTHPEQRQKVIFKG